MCLFQRSASWGLRQCIAYRFLVVKFEIPDVHVDTIMESRDAIFFENIFPMKDMHSNSRFSTEITPQPAVPIESSEQSDEHEHVLEKDDSDAPRRSKRQNPLVTISLCTLWTILTRPLQRHMHLQMKMIGKKQSKVRWTQFFLMGHGSSLNDPMVASQ